MKPISVRDRAARLTEYFSPQVIGEVNDVFVKVAKIRGDDLPWHDHAEEDELFYVLDGELLFEIEGESPFRMESGDLFIVPRAVRHRVSSREECTILLVENKTTEHLGGEDHAIVKSVDDQLSGYER